MSLIDTRPNPSATMVEYGLILDRQVDPNALPPLPRPTIVGHGLMLV